MRRHFLPLLAPFLLALCALLAHSQEGADRVAKALAEGDYLLKQRDLTRALGAYHEADKLSHHTCADCFLGMFRVHREVGDLQAALEDAKEAAKAAGNDAPKAAQAHLVRGTLLTQMASKPNDKKLREAESEVRMTLSLAPGLSIAHFDLGRILIRQERDSEGIQELQSYLAAPDKTPELALAARRIIANPIRGREPFAPDFSFATLEGENLSNAALRGKVVLFDFWGTWCPPCRESIPMLLDIHRKYRDRPFQMVGISSDQDEQRWKDFLAAHHMDWPEHLDSSSAVREAFEVNSFPTFIVLDRGGIVTYRQSGWSPLVAQELEEAINHALKRASNPAVLAAAAEPTGEPPAVPAPEAKPAESPAPPESDTGDSAPAGIISGNVYRDAALGFSYQFPADWVVVAPETVRAADAKAKADAQAIFLAQHAGENTSSRMRTFTVVFYASKSGRGDGQRISAPCVRISILPWIRSSVTLGEVQAWEEKSVPPGWQVSQTPKEVDLQGQQLFRTELMTTNQSPPVWACRILTVTHGRLLRLEALTRDKEELARLGSTEALQVPDTP
jgi:thiol-disulfide isomerase/thioredoxin